MDTMTADIVRYEGTGEARAQAWASMPDDDRKRRAAAAANTHDADELWSLAEAYLVSKGRKRGRVSPHTIRNYENGVRELVDAWQGENLLRPSRDAGDLYVMGLTAKGLASGTIRVKLAGARLLYKALRWTHATKAAPFADVALDRDPTDAAEKRKPYRGEAIDRLLTKANAVDRVIVLLGAHAGLRVSEIVALEWSDVDLEGEQLTVQSGKGGKLRVVRLSPTANKALRELRDLTEGESVFGFDTTQRARQRMKRLCERALVDYKGAHSLRHYCGTRLYQETGDLHTVAKHLGHSSIETAKIYAKWNTERLDKSVGTW